MRALKLTAGLAALLTFVLIVLGATVRVTNSGLSCPDWPTCYGSWLPLPGTIPEDAGYEYYQVMLEWVHRLIAGVFLGPLVLVVAWLALRHREERPGLAGGAALLVILLVVQAGLGGVTVLDQNSPWSVALHLGTALLVLAMTLFLTARAGSPAPAVDGAFRALVLLTWIVTFAAIVSAAMMAKMGAAMACATWPLCDGALVPDLSDPLVLVNWIHRVLAGLTVIAVLFLFLRGRRWGGAFRGLGTGALLLVLLAALLGAHGVGTFWPLWAAVTHQAIAILVFMHVTMILWKAYPGRETGGAPAAGA